MVSREPESFGEMLVWKAGFDKGLSVLKEMTNIAIEEERKRTIRIIETRSGHRYEYSLCNCDWCDLVYLINDINVL